VTTIELYLRLIGYIIIVVSLTASLPYWKLVLARATRAKNILWGVMWLMVGMVLAFSILAVTVVLVLTENANLVHWNAYLQRVFIVPTYILAGLSVMLLVYLRRGVS
jgi:hypothetical protein